MISLRLTEEEYDTLVNMSLSEGLHSTSDAARAAVCEYMTDHRPGSDRAEIQRKIEHLESEMRRLSKILEGFATLAKEQS
jgi:hypothetical protein